MADALKCQANSPIQEGLATGAPFLSTFGCGLVRLFRETTMVIMGLAFLSVLGIGAAVLAERSGAVKAPVTLLAVGVGATPITLALMGIS